MPHKIQHVLREHGTGLSGHQASKIGVPDDGDTVWGFINLILFGHRAIPTTLGCKIDDDRAWLHVLHHFISNQDWRFATWNCSSRYHNVNLFADFVESGLLGSLELC